MSRRRASIKLKVIVDPRFGNVAVAKLINYLMFDGKKYIAEDIVYDAISKLGAKLKKDPIESFEKAVEIIKPLVEVRSRRVGGSTYQIPIEVRPTRQLFKSLKWIIGAARGRTSEKGMADKLFLEFYDAYHSRGLAFKKKEDAHKMAEANKAFSHFRY
jgi:small subunit ribosomal protein S7